MLRNVLAIITLAIIMSSCGNKKVTEVTPLTVAQLTEQAENLIDSNVVVDGTVIHICKHGGKKMFIINDNPDVKFKIVASDVVTMFDASLEGSDVVVEGVLIEERIDEAYLAEWEAEVMTSQIDTMNTSEGQTGNCSHEKKTQDDGPLSQINNLRNQIKENGKGYVPFFHVVANKVTVKEVKAVETAK